MVTYGDEKISIEALARRSGKPTVAVLVRLRTGWTMWSALNEPLTPHASRLDADDGWAARGERC
jgi:hypothetical protein